MDSKYRRPRRHASISPLATDANTLREVVQQIRKKKTVA